MRVIQLEKIPLISIQTYYAKQILEGTKIYEFRKSPIKEELYHQKIYIYSAKEEKAIVGYMRVSNVLCANTEEILKLTNYDKHKDRKHIWKYFGRSRLNCYALVIEEVCEFTNYLTLEKLKSVKNNLVMPQYLTYIYEDNPLYSVIMNWENNS